MNKSSTKNEPILRSNSNIMTSWNSERDKKLFNGQLNNKNENYWSSSRLPEFDFNGNDGKCSNRKTFSKEKKQSSKLSENYKSKNRSKVMLNGVETNTLSKNFQKQEIQEFVPKNVQEIKCRQSTTSDLNRKQPDRVDKLSKLPSSLSNFENLNLVRSLIRSPHYKSIDSCSEKSYKNLLPLTRFDYLVDSIDNSLKSKEHLRCNYRSPTNYRELTKKISDSSNKLSTVSRNSFYSFKLNSPIDLTSPISRKRLNLSLPLNEDYEIDKKLSTSNKVEVRKNIKYDSDKRCSIANFSQNQPNSSLATVQTSLNRSLTLQPTVQCANKKFTNDLSIRSNPSSEANLKLPINNFDRVITNSSQINNQNKNSSDSEQDLKQLIRQLKNQVSCDLKQGELSNNNSSIELSDQTKDQQSNELYLSSKLNSDLIKFNDDLYKLCDNLLKGDLIQENETKNNFLKINQSNFRNIDQNRALSEIDKTINNRNGTNQVSFIDYNEINLKLNSHLVHLVKHSELDEKSSNLLLNLIQEDHCGFILCLGQSNQTGAKCSIGYYVGAVTSNTTAQNLLTVGDLVLEINSKPLHINSFMNLQKITDLMNYQFNLNRFLQLRIVSRTTLMNQFRKDKDLNDSIRTVVINSEKHKLTGVKDYSFGLAIKGGKEYGIGIFVSNVDKGSLSDLAGLKIGDLIISLNGYDFLNLNHDFAASLIRNTSLLILRVRNVGFVPISALLLDQNDHTTKFRCNSAIEMTDYDRQMNPIKKFDKLTKLTTRIPIQMIKDELKAQGLLDRDEIRNYLINKYGLSGLNNLLNNELNKRSTYQLNQNTIKSNDYSSNLVPSSFHSPFERSLINLSTRTMPFNSSSNLSSSLSTNVSQPTLISTGLPTHLSNKLATNYSSILPNKLSESTENDCLAPFLLIDKCELSNQTLEDELEQELILDEQLNLLLNYDDRLKFNFYKTEFLNNKISLDLFVHSIFHLFNSSGSSSANSTEKRKLFAYLRPLIPNKDLDRFDQLISIYDLNYNLMEDEYNFNDKSLYRSSSYDDLLMDREHWINATSTFNQNQDLEYTDKYFNPAFRSFISNNSRNNSFPFLNQSNYFNKQFDTMSPYHYQQQPTDLQINGQTNSSITSSTSSHSPYSNSALQTRANVATNNCSVSSSNRLNIPSISQHYYHRNQLNADQNCLTDVYSNNNLSNLHSSNFHPSSSKSNNNLIDYNEENRSPFESRNPINYPHQRLLSNHNMVRRHRSLPAGSFQREVNFYPHAKAPLPDQVQRNSSFKFSSRDCNSDECFRVRINKSKPILGIAIEGGINVTNQNEPRIISIHENGSAFESGELKIGHIILEINGISTEGLTHSEVARLLAHSYYTNPDNFIELVIKEKKSTDDSISRRIPY